ncbi:MAG: c-type cytochrome [Halieaceae bacterium]|nr:c-type cytochrome [Halieaceae bacterium]MCP5204966.1 c-type cytochrome [Pseudomonadales bacterium]
MRLPFPLPGAGARVLAIALGATAMCPALAQDPPPDDAAAVERGAQLFQQYCTECHGRDGRAQVDVISDATDLTQPAYYYSGSTDQEIYNSIANGAGVAMPAWRAKLGSDDAVWDLVYFVKTLWEN